MSTSARLSRARRAALFGAAAAVVCALLALRTVGARYLTATLDRDFLLSDIDERVLWSVMYYAMWAVLTPFIFASARRYPVRRDRWAGPLVVHGVAGLVVSAVGLVLLSVLFGGLARREWASLGSLVSSAWLQLGAVHAVADSLVYWVILAAGHGLRLYDESQARRLRTAELERSLVAAQVDSLKMKLQPHFLFNTLNTISFLAIERDTATVGEVVERLGSLLRASMASNGRHLVPLDDELALLDEYLAIEELRFKDRLRVVRRIDPAARAARVPSLVLQPIVENSIKHGFSMRLDASRLEIDARRDGEDLYVTVRDDGPGLPPGWDLATQCGRGLRNVVERLD
ncbi:MAG: histidine kinase, partial [Vicinamibacterales bacterium]|nr:histidine kinase [Vicinamibacterales bacterium]